MGYCGSDQRWLLARQQAASTSTSKVLTPCLITSKVGSLFSPRLGRQQPGPQAWAPEPTESCFRGELCLAISRTHQGSQTLIKSARCQSSNRTHPSGTTCLCNDASLTITVGIVSKTNDRQDHTTASPLSLCNRPARGDKQPRLKRCFCKLHSVGPKDYHYVNYIPQIFHLSLAYCSGSRVDADAFVNAQCRPCPHSLPDLCSSSLRAAVSRVQEGWLCPGANALL